MGTLVLAFLATHPDPPVWWETEIAVAAISSSVVVYVGYRLNDDDFESPESWRVLKTSVVGMVGAVAVGGVFYALQTVEGAGVAEPAFVFEYLGLAGGAMGAGYGLLSTPTSEVDNEDAGETEDAKDSDAENEADSEEDVNDIVTLLGEDVTAEAVKQRLTVVDCLLEEGGGETPIPSLAVFLTRRDIFAGDAEEVEKRLREDHLPALSGSGVVEVDENADVAKYTGPEKAASALRKKEV